MNLIVFNLTASIIDRDLWKLFEAYGQVNQVLVLRDPQSGRSLGTALLHMPNRAQREQAIRALHQTLLDGQRILVQTIEYKADEFNN